MAVTGRNAFVIVLVVCLSLAAASPASAQAPAGDSWKVTILPYLMGASMSGTTTVKGQEVTVDMSASDIFSNLQFGAMGLVVARKGNWGVGGDAIWMALGANGTAPGPVGVTASDGSKTWMDPIVAAAQAVPAGKATIRFEFAYDGGGLAKGGLGTIYVNDKKVAEGRVERTEPMMFSPDDAADVGVDEGTPVTEEYKSSDSTFTGKILKVTVDVKEMGAGEKAAAGAANAEAAKKLEAAK